VELSSVSSEFGLPQQRAAEPLSGWLADTEDVTRRERQTHDSVSRNSFTGPARKLGVVLNATGDVCRLWHAILLSEMIGLSEIVWRKRSCRRRACALVSGARTTWLRARSVSSRQMGTSNGVPSYGSKWSRSRPPCVNRSHTAGRRRRTASGCRWYPPGRSSRQSPRDPGCDTSGRVRRSCLP
jgi:hypothetical protein